VPRAGLSTERVVAAAEQLIDAEARGGELTLAALAARLDVRVPSLYKHVDGLAGLGRLVAIRAKHELASVMTSAAVGVARDDAVLALARAYRGWALEHPGRYALTQRPALAGDAEDETVSARAVQIVLDVLAGYGLEGDAAIDATRSLRAAIHGFVALETAGGFGLPRDVDRSFDWFIGGLTTAFASGGKPAK
jgi:AcrR family transcriptional regulator